MSKTIFTSESVCAGHPDKIADTISDTLLDALISQDPDTRAGIETVVGNNHVSIFGEVNSRAKIKYEKITRKTIKSLGYTNPKWGFSDKSSFTNYIHQQSNEIAIGVDNEGAGDQGMMFGYACNETKELMPLPIVMAHEITSKLDKSREDGKYKWLRPDGKSQVTILYENGIPIEVTRIVVAVAQDEKTKLEAVRKIIIKEILLPIVKSHKLKLPSEEEIIINGTGAWFIPGPYTDAGLTGRKIVVDGYGGYVRVGGGAFSGKDATKVDRSGAYAARYIAKNIVANKYADKCEIGLAYAIGHSQPVMISIETFGTEKVSRLVLKAFIDSIIDLSVSGIINKLELRKPIYSKTTNYGHFGKKDLPWERIVKSNITIL